MAKSVFIEGTDGSGKSTQVELLKKYLQNRGESVITLREPGGTDYYEAIRELYLHAPYEHPPISDALISAAGRAANIEASRNALADGKWVITDRAYPSTFVYQSVQGVPLEDIKVINAYALQGFEYDVKILLDVPVDVALKRIDQSSPKKDHWESKGSEFFEEIRKKYLELARIEGYTVIDASANPDKIHAEIITVVGF